MSDRRQPRADHHRPRCHHLRPPRRILEAKDKTTSERLLCCRYTRLIGSDVRWSTQRNYFATARLKGRWNGDVAMLFWLTIASCQLGFGCYCAHREIVTLPFCTFSIYLHADRKALLLPDVRIVSGYC